MAKLAWLASSTVIVCCNLAEIADTLQASVPRVHQLKAQALAQLREALEGVAEIV